MQSRNVCPVFDTGTDVITGRKQKFRRCVQKGTSPLDCLPAPIALQLAHARPHPPPRSESPRRMLARLLRCGFYSRSHPRELTGGAYSNLVRCRTEMVCKLFTFQTLRSAGLVYFVA